MAVLLNINFSDDSSSYKLTVHTGGYNIFHPVPTLYSVVDPVEWVDVIATEWRYVKSALQRLPDGAREAFKAAAQRELARTDLDPESILRARFTVETLVGAV